MQPNPQGQETNQVHENREVERREIAMPRSNWPVYLLVFALIAVLVIGYVYVSHQKQQARDLAATNQGLTTSLTQMQNQLQSVTERLNDLQTRAAAPPAAPARVRSSGTARVRPASEARVTRDDPRFGKIQSQLSEHEKQLASAREDINKTQTDLSQTRDDLQTNINSTKDELNGSIARTHDDIVALQKRGERNYYEFAIDKSKQYSRVGPLNIELRKADTKHKRFDMQMLVDDNQLQKKSVNLYETVWINLSDRPQPLELVVNKITKDHIEGYLSEPKYRKSELEPASATSANDAAKPASPISQ